MDNIQNILVNELMKFIHHDIKKEVQGKVIKTDTLVKAAQKVLVSYIPNIFDQPHTRTLDFSFKVQNTIDPNLPPQDLSFKLPVNETALLLEASKCKST